MYRKHLNNCCELFCCEHTWHIQWPGKIVNLEQWKYLLLGVMYISSHHFVFFSYQDYRLAVMLPSLVTFNAVSFKMIWCLWAYLKHKALFIAFEIQCISQFWKKISSFLNCKHAKHIHVIIAFGAYLSTLNVRGPGYLDLTGPISWLLMHWLRASPGHQRHEIDYVK